uniref:Uncharacterized protein n=1 Tax=Mycobacterium riyadhense TaxID=486698 RepID=A0A653F3B6_9MYCO|nr:hypothetical protein BIN_B_05109 [Mycobacterium riyadhense]
MRPLHTPPTPTFDANSATVGVSNNTKTETSASNALLIAAITRIADSESPPSSKNESSTPTRSSPNTRAKIPAKISSTALDGARYRSRCPYSGAGKARVSSLPFTVSGNSSSTTTAAGTI